MHRSQMKQHHSEPLGKALQHQGDAPGKRLSRCLRLLHWPAKAYLSASNPTPSVLMRPILRSSDVSIPINFAPNRPESLTAKKPCAVECGIQQFRLSNGLDCL